MMNRVEEKIFKLLRLALDQDGRPEGSLAARRAAELMEQHGVTVTLEDGREERPAIVERRYDGAAAGWMDSIFYSLAMFVGAYMFLTPSRSEGRYVAFTTATGHALLEQLFAALVAECHRGAARQRRDRRARRAYREGFARGLREKVTRIVRERERAARAHAQERGLVLVDSRGRAEEMAKALYPGITLRKRRVRTSEAGKRDGRAASLAAGVRGSAGRRTLPAAALGRGGR